MSSTRKKKPSPPQPAAAAVVEEGDDLVAVVLDRITNDIVAGRLAIGEALPAEGTLAQSFGVSRTVMREAMRTLRAHGLIRMSRGRRPQVKPPSLQDAVFAIDLLLRRNRASLTNLLEVRRPMESAIAAIAAWRANDEHVRQLEQSIDELTSAPDLPSRVEADSRFHRVLTEATGNPVFVLLLQALDALLQESRAKTLNYSGVDQAVAGHLKIIAAIKDRDATAASQAMLDHLRSAAQDIHNSELKS